MIIWKRSEPRRQLSKHFNSNEFMCPCNICSIQMIEPELVKQLENLREDTKKSIHVLSGFRCELHNNALMKLGLKASKQSQHKLGKAVDVYCDGFSGRELAKLASKYFKRIGIARNWIHVDVAVGIDATWYYPDAKDDAA